MKSMSKSIFNGFNADSIRSSWGAEVICDMVPNEMGIGEIGVALGEVREIKSKSQFKATDNDGNVIGRFESFAAAEDAVRKNAAK